MILIFRGICIQNVTIAFNLTNALAAITNSDSNLVFKSYTKRKIIVVACVTFQCKKKKEI